MFTEVHMSDGVLHVKLYEQDGEVDVATWRESLGPAVAWLKLNGGGEALVPHRPGDLTPLG